jgi:hypothetical protein
MRRRGTAAFPSNAAAALAYTELLPRCFMMREQGQEAQTAPIARANQSLTRASLAFSRLYLATLSRTGIHSVSLT